MSLRKSLSETSAPSPAPMCHTLFAHFSNSTSWVTPRSSEIASNSVRPGDLRLLEGSPPSRCFTTSVVRLSIPHLLTPATYLPSHLTRNLKFLYGSKRCALAVNCAIRLPSLGRDLSGHLLDLDNYKFRRLQWGKADHNVDDAQVDVILCGSFLVALYKICVGRRYPLESVLPEQVMHKSANVQPNLRPQRLVVGLKHDPFQCTIKTFLNEQGRAPNRHVFPL